MTWWCVAQDVAWTWQWRPYPGVWLFVAALGLGYAWLLGRAPASDGRRATPGQIASFTLGLLSLWLVTDWPVGALGAGYLVSVHTGQWLVYSLVAPPLLLIGLPPGLLQRWAATPASARALRILAHPAMALAVFNLVLFATHLPPVVDGFRRSQLGSFLIDIGWLGGGLALWWPVRAPAPFGRLSEPWKIGYLFASTILPTVPAAFLTFSEYPLYAVYELAPRIGGFSASADQQIAGLAMKALGDPIIWIAMAVVFFRWQRAEEDADRREREARRAAREG